MISKWQSQEKHFRCDVCFGCWRSCSVFVDLEKAFYRVPRKQLLYCWQYVCETGAGHLWKHLNSSEVSGRSNRWVQDGSGIISGILSEPIMDWGRQTGRNRFYYYRSCLTPLAVIVQSNSKVGLLFQCDQQTSFHLSPLSVLNNWILTFIRWNYYAFPYFVPCIYSPSGGGLHLKWAVIHIMRPRKLCEQKTQAAGYTKYSVSFGSE